MTTTARSPAFRLAASSVVLLAAGALAGCGGSDDQPSTSASSASSSPSSPSDSAATSSSAPASETSASSPSATSTGPAPATGPAVSFSSLSLNIPDGWQPLYKTRVSVTGSDPDDTGGLGTVIVNDLSGLSTDTLDSEAKYALMSAKRDGVKTATRGPNITVNGVEGYVVSGSSKTYGVYYVFGTVTNGHEVTLLFQYADQTADAQATIDSVLASISWT